MQQIIRMQTGGYTGADISAVRDATGAIYLTFQHSGQQRVIRRDVSGATMPIALPQTVSGRGQLAVFGSELMLVAWNEAEGKGVCYIQPIPGYVAPTPAPGGGPVPTEDAAAIAEFGSEAWPNYGQPYPDETLITDGRWHLRANKIVGLLVQLARAVAQLQRLAKARGELR